MQLPTLGMSVTGAILRPATTTWFATGMSVPGHTGAWLLLASVAVLIGMVVVSRRLVRRPSGSLLHTASVATPEPWGRARWLVPLTLLAGTGLRFYRLGDGLWFDEIQTLVDYVRLPLGRIVTTYDSQNQHLFYSVLAKLSTTALGEGAFSLRLPAAVLGVASLWAIYRLAREVGHRREAVLAMVILTVSYHHVWFSQNARGYTGLLLGTLLGSWALMRLLSDATAGGKWIALYAVSMALAAYTHVTAALVSVVHVGVVCALAIRSREPGAWRRPTLALAMSGSIGLVLYAPVLTQFIGTVLAPSPYAASTEWQNPLWLVAETATGLTRGLPGGWFGLGVGLCVGTAGLVSFVRQSPPLAALMVLPAALTAMAMVGLGHNLWPRFFFFSAGFAVLVGVRGTFAIARLVLGRRGEAVATAALVLAGAGSAFTAPRAWGPKQDYEGAARYIAAREQPGDAVVTADLTTYPFTAFLGKPWRDVDGPEALTEEEGSHSRVWLLYTFPVRLAAVQPQIWARLQAAYDTAAVFPGTVSGGEIVVMVHRPTPPAP